MAQHNENSNLEIQTLSSTEFGSIGDMRRVALASTDPVLLIVSPLELAEVLCWITEKDDVCLYETPAELIEYRKRCLAKEVSAKRDVLTGLINRQQFEVLLEQAANSASINQPVSLIACDLDYFKLINDQHGHQAGDEVLKYVATVLAQHCDQSSAVARIGGEEFFIICNRDAASARLLAEKLREEIAAGDAYDEIPVSASMGIATALESMPATELRAKVEKALYAAKDSGRNCSTSFDELVANSRAAGKDVDLFGLENQARVLAQRVANVITMQSRNILESARQEADVDALTGCYTRRYLDRRLNEEFNHREQSQLSVAFLDLDYFGKVNKKFGWPTGDRLLVAVCDTIGAELREADWVGRYGGEEFCIIMPNTNLETAHSVLERIRHKVETTDFSSVDGIPVDMTVSIGAAVSQTSDAQYSSLVERASTHALTAKNRGRNQLCIGQ